MTSIAPPPPELALRIHGVSKVCRLCSTPVARLWVVSRLQRLHGLLHRPLPRLAQRLQAVVEAHLHGKPDHRIVALVPLHYPQTGFHGGKCR
ncbi:MAG: hypothetical protein KGJ32_09330 [Xanthomonadaceae bacterium]|nr:hypothetical protein [Xanthomonadaceae bacterium]